MLNNAYFNFIDESCMVVRFYQVALLSYPFLVLFRNTIMLNHVITQFSNK